MHLGESRDGEELGGVDEGETGRDIFHERRIYFLKNDKIVKMVEELPKCGTVTRSEHIWLRKCDRIAQVMSL